jgi:hypothetical protein
MYIENGIPISHFEDGSDRIQEAGWDVCLSVYLSVGADACRLLADAAATVTIRSRVPQSISIIHHLTAGFDRHAWLVLLSLLIVLFLRTGRRELGMYGRHPNVEVYIWI